MAEPVYYHGTARPEPGVFRPGRVAYFSTEIEDAIEHAKMDSEVDGEPPAVVTARLHINKTAILPIIDAQDLHFRDDLLEPLKQQGYDSATYELGEDPGQEMVVFDPSSIEVLDVKYLNDAERVVEALLENDEIDPKQFLSRTRVRNKPLRVSGSYGEFVIDKDSGTILERVVYDTTEDEYADIIRFDPQELIQWLKKNRVRADIDKHGVDIVDIGFWVEGEEPGSEVYVAAEEDHREISYLGREP